MIHPPEAPKRDHMIELHGESWNDPYFWLRNKEDPDVIKYLEAENEYTDHLNQHTEVVQDHLYQEMKNRINEDDQTVPTSEGGYLYYSRTETGKDYRIYCRKLDMEGSHEEIILDVNELARGKKYTNVGTLKISPDHRLLAYSVDHSGYLTYEIHIRNLMTGREYAYVLNQTGGSVEWADNNALYYNSVDDINRSFRLHYHLLNQPQNDILLFEEENTELYIKFSKSTDKKYLLVNSTGRETDVYFYIDIEKNHHQLSIFQEWKEGVEYDIDHHQGYFYFITSWDAINFRLCRVKVGLGQDQWEELIPHNTKIRLEGLQLFRDFGVLKYRAFGNLDFRIFTLPEYFDFTIQLPSNAHDVDFGRNPNFRTSSFRFTYSTLVTPVTVYEYQVKDRKLNVLKVDEVKGYDQEKYVTERKLVKGRDGTLIPLSIAYNKTAKKPGPVLLYGYGSYGFSEDPGFSSLRISLLNRGVIFVIAHVRGGGEYGKQWYHQGKILKKMNSFTDFIDCAEFLLRDGYTTPDRLAINGRSAGGLLVAAVTNFRPDLFKTVICEVPFVDVIGTMMDESIPLTTFEFLEWGNPKSSEAEFRYMMNYSPYDQVGRISAEYPDMLITGGLNDPLVHYWEPAKYTARLRELRTDNNKLFLKMNMGAGHGGSSGRYEYMRETAFRYAFLLDSLDLL